MYYDHFLFLLNLFNKCILQDDTIDCNASRDYLSFL